MNHYFISRYVIESKTSSGDYLLFSTVSKAVIQLNPLEYAALKNHQFELFKADTIDVLAKSAIITEDENETKAIKNKFDNSRKSPKTFSTYISFSPNCNFKCVYCYQGEKTLSSEMTSMTLDSVCNWYAGKISLGKYSKVLVTLFGGEPLLSLSHIEKFNIALKDICSKSHVELKYKIVTNGYLLTQDIVAFLKSIGVVEMQVTLDGARDVHDQRRPLADGSGTYEKIINNLACYENCGIDIVVRVSFDKSNLSTIKQLIEDLKLRGIKNISVYFSPIHQTIEQITQKESFCSMCAITNDNELIDTYKALYSLLFSYNYEIPTYYSNGPCMLRYSNSCLITHTGELFKCVEMVCNSSLCVGNVVENNYNELYDSFMDCAASGQCFAENCKFIPMCAGGCAMQSYLKTGNAKNRDCQKNVIIDLTTYLLSLKYGNCVNNIELQTV